MKRITMAVLLLMVASSAMVLSGCSKPPGKPAEPTEPARPARQLTAEEWGGGPSWVFYEHKWSEYYSDAKQQRVKVEKLLDGESFIADSETFSKIWKIVYGKDRPVPPIRWDKEIVLYYVLTDTHFRTCAAHDAGNGELATFSAAIPDPRDTPSALYRWVMVTSLRRCVSDHDSSDDMKSRLSHVRMVNGKRVPPVPVPVILTEDDFGKTIPVQIDGLIWVKLKPLKQAWWSMEHATDRNRLKGPTGSGGNRNWNEFLYQATQTGTTQICAKRPGEDSPMEKITLDIKRRNPALWPIELTELDNGKTISAKVGDLIRIELKYYALSGRDGSWNTGQIANQTRSGQASLAILKRVWLDKTCEVCWAPAYDVFVYRVERPGNATITHQGAMNSEKQFSVTIVAKQREEE